MWRSTGKGVLFKRFDVKVQVQDVLTMSTILIYNIDIYLRISKSINQYFSVLDNK